MEVRVGTVVDESGCSQVSVSFSPFDCRKKKYLWSVRLKCTFFLLFADLDIQYPIWEYLKVHFEKKDISWCSHNNVHKSWILYTVYLASGWPQLCVHDHNKLVNIYFRTLFYVHLAMASPKLFCLSRFLLWKLVQFFYFIIFVISTSTFQFGVCPLNLPFKNHINTWIHF